MQKVLLPVVSIRIRLIYYSDISPKGIPVVNSLLCSQQKHSIPGLMKVPQLLLGCRIRIRNLELHGACMQAFLISNECTSSPFLETSTHNNHRAVCEEVCAAVWELSK